MRVRCVQATGRGRELGGADQRWLDFLYEVGEIAARGGDVRSHVFGG
jgi:hypothetical protein